MTDKEKQAIKYWKRELHCYEYTKDLDLASENYFGQFEEKINMISEILNLIETQAKELEKKDKMIDKSIEIIANNTVPQDKCKQCIKQYFEREVCNVKTR